MENRPDELERIKKAGGKVVNGRVLSKNRHSVGMTRAFGDIKFKYLEGAATDQQPVIPIPEVEVWSETPRSAHASRRG